MRSIISLILLLVAGFLAYTLYTNIQEPIAFQAEKATRLDKVTGHLENIRKSQEIYRTITGEFAPTFDTLSMVLKNDSIPFINIVGDPDDPTKEFTKTITYSSALDSITALNINLDSLRYVPYSASKEFNMTADTITYQQTLVQVVEVGTRYKEFMGKYASQKFTKYDNSYDPNALLKFGDMSKPTLSGNW